MESDAHAFKAREKYFDSSIKGAKDEILARAWKLEAVIDAAHHPDLIDARGEIFSDYFRLKFVHAWIYGPAPSCAVPAQPQPSQLHNHNHNHWSGLRPAITLSLHSRVPNPSGPGPTVL